MSKDQVLLLGRLSVLFADLGLAGHFRLAYDHSKYEALLLMSKTPSLQEICLANFHNWKPDVEPAVPEERLWPLIPRSSFPVAHYSDTSQWAVHNGELRGRPENWAPLGEEELSMKAR